MPMPPPLVQPAAVKASRSRGLHDVPVVVAACLVRVRERARTHQRLAQVAGAGMKVTLACGIRSRHGRRRPKLPFARQVGGCTILGARAVVSPRARPIIHQRDQHSARIPVAPCPRIRQKSTFPRLVRHLAPADQSAAVVGRHSAAHLAASRASGARPQAASSEAPRGGADQALLLAEGMAGGAGLIHQHLAGIAVAVPQRRECAASVHLVLNRAVRIEAEEVGRRYVLRTRQRG
mmetsp:Transcript_145945/g.467897  ORF Transcript_145945/g.467897 Transcript_145945/m.467897 type:complete len:235 (-) Transcript_145945:2032-2736(-)